MTEKTGKNAVKMRTKEIQKAIKLLGWLAVSERIRTPEDRAIFGLLSQEYNAERRVIEDERLKKHHIIF